jgi:O-antigen/teichoic acid export membrane protein
MGVETLADQTIVSGANWCTAAIIARLCPPTELGIFILGYTILLALAEVQASLISHPYTVFSSRLVGRASALYTGSSLVYQAMLAAVAVVAVATGALAAHVGWGPVGLSEVLAALAIVLPLVLLKEHVRRICFAALHIRRALLVDGLASLAQLGLLLLFGLHHQLSARSAYWSIGIASAVAVFTWLVLWRSEIAFDARNARAGLKETWSFGKWILGGNMATLLSQQLYPWFLAWRWGPAATGVLAACMGLIAVSNPAVYAAGNILGPTTAHAFTTGRTALRRVVVRAIALMAPVALASWLVIALFGGRALVLIYGEQYRGNSWLLTLLAVSSAMYAAFLAAGFGTWAMGRSDVNCVINVGALVGTVTIGMWLVNVAGLSGVGYGLLVTNGLAAVGRWVGFERLVVKERMPGDAPTS